MNPYEADWRIWKNDFRAVLSNVRAAIALFPLLFSRTRLVNASGLAAANTLKPLTVGVTVSNR